MSYWYWWRFWEENQEAFVKLPDEVKQIITVALVIGLGASVFNRAFRFVRYLIIAAIIYFGLTYFGVI